MRTPIIEATQVISSLLRWAARSEATNRRVLVIAL